jgi:hypothetical protein
MHLAETRGIETNTGKIYDTVIHHAALSDIVVSAIRKPGEKPWLIPEPVSNWKSSCYLSPDGVYLRRIVLVSNWGEERKASECRSWFTLGEIAAYNMPMQLIVAVLGQQRDGFRHGPWVQGFLHPCNHKLRFRKKGRSTSETFNERWQKIYREDHDEIKRETWLQGMLTDGVLPEVLFRFDLPTLPEVQRQRILDMAARKTDRLQNLKSLPEANLSTCDFPMPCCFRHCCHSNPEREPSEKLGFIRIT